jgi:cytochrome c oxidase subunit 2
MFPPASEQAAIIADLFTVVFWLGVAVFVVVQSLIIYAAIRFRRRAADAPPAAIGKTSTALEIVWAVAPGLLLVALLVLTLQSMQRLNAPPAGEPLRIEVIGHQWWWEFRYPTYTAEGGALGVVTATELHVPVGRPISLTITSADVIHSFWAPQLGGKTDAIPNHVNLQSLLVTQPGEYAGQCSELCGEQHAMMRLFVVAQPPAEFDAWMQAQQRAARAPAPGDPARPGYDLFVGNTRTAGGELAPCLGCHTVRGTRATGGPGPDLTHLAGRTRIVSGNFDNTAENLTRWLHDPQALKPGAGMVFATRFTDAERAALVAYLLSLK